MSNKKSTAYPGRETWRKRIILLLRVLVQSLEVVGWSSNYLPNDLKKPKSFHPSPPKIKFSIICHQISLVGRQVLSFRLTNLFIPNLYIQDDIFLILHLQMHCTIILKGTKSLTGHLSWGLGGGVQAV